MILPPDPLPVLTPALAELQSLLIEEGYMCYVVAVPVVGYLLAQQWSHAAEHTDVALGEEELRFYLIQTVVHERGI